MSFRIDSCVTGMWLTRPPRVNGEIDDARDAEARQAPVVVDVVAVAPLVGDERRRDVVEEAAPLVVVDEHRAALVLGRLDESVRDVRHERLAQADVAVRVLVGREAVAAAAVQEGRVHEGDLRQVAGRRVRIELRDRAGPRDATRSVERREGQVRVVVADRDAVCLCAVE